MFAQIILPLNLKGTFTYEIPDLLQENIEVGMRVLVPFGGRKIYTGIVLSVEKNLETDFKTKEIISILDSKPIIPKEQLEFWQWISSYYLTNIGSVYRLALPSSLKLESETYLKLKSDLPINWQNLDANETYVLQALEVKQVLSLQEIEAFVPKKEMIKTINSLLDNQLIVIDEKIFEKYKIKEIAYLKIKKEILENGDFPKILSGLDRSPKQKEMFLLILSKQNESKENCVKKSAIFEETKFSSVQLKSLKEKGLVEEFYLQKDRISSYEGDLETIEILSQLQQKADKLIDEAFLENKNVLLHGVTSSGKTHIYLKKIEETIAQGKNVLLLLPEIALTKQIIQRIEKKYGPNLGFYHSKLSDFEKVEVWKKIRNNDIKVLVGTRNALFLPYQDLGLIIVDEEHDGAYKRKGIPPYFNAKDSAIMLAQFYRSNLILGSATPSVESYYAAKKEKLKYVFLGERFGGKALPKMELINFKEEQDLKKTQGNFSEVLLSEIRKCFDEDKQTIILHNRRGFANVAECQSCGHVSYCSNCDVVLTYHKSSNEMKCHYCGQHSSKPIECPSCHSKKINFKGIGVEQITEEIEKIFPPEFVNRMDIDSMRKKFSYEKLFENLELGKTKIVVGTQMIAKGLNFEGVELVAIPKADSLLYVQDFRAEERAYQLITQVAGRAGRSSGKGKIMLQTYHPEASFYKLITTNDAEAIYGYFLDERKKYLYPPFVKLISIEIKHRKEDKAERASRFLASVLSKYLPEECILGPEKEAIFRLNNLYQFQILLKLPKSKKYFTYKNYVEKSLEEFGEISAYKSIKLNVYTDY